MCSRFTAIFLIAGIPAAVFADTSSPPLEEVVVRAGFYDTTLMHSAGSISVIDSTEIADRAARHLDQIEDRLGDQALQAGAHDEREK